MKDLRASLARDGRLPAPAQVATFRRSRPDFETDNALAWKRLRDWRGWQQGRNLYLSGPMGTGKTHAGRCLLNRATVELRTAAELSPVELARLSFDFNRDLADFPKCRADVLLLDDLDKRQPSARLVEAVYTLLDLRADRKLCTIVTANRSPKGLKEHLLRGAETADTVQAALDRLALRPEDVLEFQGASLRGRG